VLGVSQKGMIVVGEGFSLSIEKLPVDNSIHNKRNFTQEHSDRLLNVMFRIGDCGTVDQDDQLAIAFKS
jgi:hypothetical protein